jgi:hypothetical protein
MQNIFFPTARVLGLKKQTYVDSLISIMENFWYGLR